MKNIGIHISTHPKKSCEDQHCPFHGKLSIRGKVLTGLVHSDKMNFTKTVVRNYLHYVKRYMRYEKRRDNLLVHNPPCIETKVGDIVKIAECKPISKNVSFVVIEKIKE
jgi:small subunit ribosomal protein S17